MTTQRLTHILGVGNVLVIYPDNMFEVNSIKRVYIRRFDGEWHHVWLLEAHELKPSLEVNCRLWFRSFKAAIAFYNNWLFWAATNWSDPSFKQAYLEKYVEGQYVDLVRRARQRVDKIRADIINHDSEMHKRVIESYRRASDPW